MISRVALFAASLVASLVLAASLAVAGFAPGAAPAAPAASATGAPAADSAPVQVDTVYVAPPPPQQTITVHKVAPGGGEPGEGPENGGND